MRIDVWLCEKKFYSSRQRAQDEIKLGRVFINGEIVQKASLDVNERSHIEISETRQYVSKGAYKLLKALQVFKIDVNNLTCIDVGASTGGFSEVLLERGAKSVFCVDTGKDQLAEKIRKDNRVKFLENTNFLSLQMPDKKFDILVCDVSFVSILKIKKQIKKFADNAVVLIKPQFECGLEIAKKMKGIILDKDVHMSIIENIIENFKNEGLFAKEIAFSPIKGGDGNIEYLLHLTKEDFNCILDLKKIVYEAFNELN